MKDLTDTDLATQPIARQLAHFAAALTHKDIPDAVTDRARHLMLDAWGIALASTQYDFGHRMHAAMSELGAGGTRRAVGFGTALMPRDAAMLNGFLIHGLDYDDTHTGGVIHATASVLPAAFTMAAEVGATGREMQTAYVAGMEVATRLGAVARGGFHQVGFHPTGIIGIFGATVAAGRLRGLTEAQLAAAQGIALSMASGSLEFLSDGAWTKRAHPGWAAQAAITAVTMARHGYVAPKAVYEGRFGLFNAYLGEGRAARADLGLATAGLGEVWEVMNVAVKPMPACHFTHAVADAAVALRAEHGLTPEDIAEVTALIPEEVVKTVCEPVATKQKPQNSYDAQFSVPYAVASGLLRGHFGLADLDPDAFTAPDALALCAKVSYAHDPNSRFPKYYSGEVIVRTTDGRELRHREDVNRGASDRPLTNDEIVAKFTENACMATPPARAERLRAALLGLAEAPDVLGIERLLAGQAA
ncbi:MmgE/PrpD family protein [Acidimangrovimonas sediminis]|uniref:MmgE/PrpD family protein n=1 Tax=Acidimangrovimonas sediminis TaxID=2056283 RepID=UPI000C804689|nr:MmgE/PrpD family protein [Acidimangrovimonas sediminis]